MERYRLHLNFRLWKPAEDRAYQFLRSRRRRATQIVSRWVVETGEKAILEMAEDLYSSTEELLMPSPLEPPKPGQINLSFNGERIEEIAAYKFLKKHNSSHLVIALVNRAMDSYGIQEPQSDGVERTGKSDQFIIDVQLPVDRKSRPEAIVVDEDPDEEELYQKEGEDGVSDSDQMDNSILNFLDSF